MLTDEEAVDDALASAARLNCTLWAEAAEQDTPLIMNKKVHVTSQGTPVEHWTAKRRQHPVH